MYDNARIALRDLQDPIVLERVAFHVLRPRNRDLRLTAATGDAGADGYVRRLFSSKDDLRVMVSLEKSWTKKLDEEIGKIRAQKPKDRAPRALFVTNRTATEVGKKPRVLAARRLKVALEIVDLTWLVSQLETDALRWVAEFELGVRPREPRALIGPDEFLAQMGNVVPGFDAELVGRDPDLEAIAKAIADTTAGAPRVIVVGGAGGIGKSRIAVEAARRAATTLVAMAGVKVDRAALTEVPLKSPAVIVVDDAHRSPDLTGIATMLGDSRYNSVKVVLTTRPGLADNALEQAGLEAHPRVDVPLDLLDRPQINAIVQGHGLHDDGFTVAVIDIAQGNPLLAHLACDVAIRTGRFGISDVTDLLRQGVARRLSGLGRDARAVAVALALTGTAEGGAELMHLRDAVRHLPDSRNELDGLLVDVADAGLASVAPPAYGHGPVYALRPELFAPVLVADALKPTDTNAINVPAALAAIGAGHGCEDVGILGLAPVTADATGFDVARVAPRLAVLAQAAHLAGDTVVAARLGRGVLELLPDPATAAGWRATAVLAAQVAGVAPQVFDELWSALRKQWPLPPAPPSPYFDDPDRLQALELEQLLQAVESLVSREGSAAPRAAVRLLLTTAALAAPVTDVGRGPRHPALESTRAATAWGTGRYATVEEVLANRAMATDAIRGWLRNDTSDMPQAVAGHVALRAITPLIKPAAEMQWMGTPDAADVIVMSSGWLPTDPRTRASALAAADVVAELIAALDPADPASASVLKEVVRLPAELVAEGRRGLLSADTPTPRHITNTLATAASTLRAAVAARWADLPLWARHDAVAADNYYGRRSRTVAQRASGGDPVAGAAVADQQLQQLMVLTAVDRGGPESMTDPVWEQHVQTRQAGAIALAATVAWQEAVQLLDAADHTRSRDFADNAARAAFAQEIGRRAGQGGEAVPVLDALTSTTRREWARPLLLGLLETAPTVIEALSGRSSRPAVTLLALSVANDVAADTRRAILDVAQRLATDPGRQRTGRVRRAIESAGRWVRRQPEPALDPARAEVAHQLATALYRGPDPASERMDRLLALGGMAPGQVVPTILRLATYSIRTEARRSGGAAVPPVDDHLVTPTPAQAAQLVAILARRLDEADSRYDLDDDTGIAVSALAVAAPEELADELAPRLVGRSLGGHWPLGWDHHLQQLSPEARVPFVSALRSRLDAARTAHPVDEVTAFDLDRAVASIAAGTDEWAADVAGWAQGDEDDRARAVASIARAWRNPAWPGVVALLLTRGVSDRQRAELLYGIDIRSFGPDIAEKAGKPRLEALDRLSATSQDPEVTHFIDDARRRVAGEVQSYHDDARARRRGYRGAAPQ